jgi:hypothetical protein
MIGFSNVRLVRRWDTRLCNHSTDRLLEEAGNFEQIFLHDTLLISTVV